MFGNQRKAMLECQRNATFGKVERVTVTFGHQRSATQANASRLISK